MDSTYDHLPTEALKNLCKERKLELNRASKRKAIIEALLQFDMEGRGGEGNKVQAPGQQKGNNSHRRSNRKNAKELDAEDDYNDDESGGLESYDSSLNSNSTKKSVTKKKSQAAAAGSNIQGMKMNELRDLYLQKGGRHPNKHTREELISILTSGMPISDDDAEESMENNSLPVSDVKADPAVEEDEDHAADDEASSSSDCDPSESSSSNPKNLHSMNVPQLKRECKRLKIIGYRKLHRQELISLIEEHLKTLSDNTNSNSKDKKKVMAAAKVEDENDFEVLVNRLREMGFELAHDEVTRDEIKLHLQIDTDTFERLKEASGEDWESLVQENKISDKRSSLLVLIQHQQSNSNDVVYGIVETSNVKSRLGMLTAQYGHVKALAQFELNHPIFVKQLCYTYLSSCDWATLQDDSENEESSKVGNLTWISKKTSKRNPNSDKSSFEDKVKQIIAFNTSFHVWGNRK